MSKVKNIFLLLTFLINPSIAFMNTIPTQTVPFANISTPPNGVITAVYTFGLNPIIFCYTNTLQTTGSIVWPYKGRLYSGSLPIYLKTNANYQGSFADASGTLSITNTANTIQIISCQYGF